MTYYYNYSRYTNYEFTAFKEQDLVSGNLDCGDIFTMPASASVCIIVKYNDSYLSGDSRTNEHADDHNGQWASIQSTSGEKLGTDGAQIYGEVYWWVKDQDGNWYVMIEIEQEGSSQDYFTFFTGSGYGLPPAGATLTVHSSQNIDNCGWQPDFKCLDAGDKTPPTGSISGTVWCDTDCDGIQDTKTTTEKGDDVFKDSVTFESVACTTYNVDCYGNWYSTGADVIDLVVGADQGHHGNSTHNTLVELDKGGTWKRSFDVDKAGTYCLTLDVYKNYCIGTSDNKFDIKVNGVVVDTVTVGSDGKVQLSFDLAAGANKIEFVSKSGVSGFGAGIDNIQLNQVITTTTPLEMGKAGVTVKLLDLDGNVVATTTTDSNGNYKFEDVPVGDYKIMGVAPDGTEFTIQDAGSDDAVDSDVDAGGKSDTVTLTANGHVDIDLGLCEKPALGSISGTVFCDTDCDGLSVEPGEHGNFFGLRGQDISNVVVYYDRDGDGEIDFSVKVDNFPDGASTTFISNDLDDFFGQLNAYIVANVPELSDSTTVVGVSIKGGTIPTQFYRMDGDTNGDAPDPGPTQNTGPGNDVELVYADFHATYDPSLGGGGVVPEPTKQGVTVMLLDAAGVLVATTTTDANGNYSFEDLAPGDYMIMGVAPDGTEFTIQDVDGNSQDDIDSDVGADGKSGLITVAPNSTTDIDLGLCKKPEPGSLSGRYFCDTDNDDVDDGQTIDPGIAGVVVTLFDAGGNAVGTTTTGVQGEYSFGNLAAGTYSVQFTDPAGVLAGKQLVEPNVEDQTTAEGTGDEIDSDAVGDTTTSTISGITVLAGQDTPNNDAGAEKTAALGDTVFFDFDRDGIQDAGETGVENVTVTLTGGGADGVIGTSDDTTVVQTTDGNGNYLFEGLDPGTQYKVTFSNLPGGTQFTLPNQGVDDATDSDADPVTGMTQIVTLAAGEVNLTLDAGLVPLANEFQPLPDEAKTCADEVETVDVLANDIGGAGFTITHVDGKAITPGGFVTTSAGTIVTLSGGQLVVDGEDAYADLDIGETAIESISYTVSDANGFTGTTDLIMTFCGDANSVGSFLNTIPSSGSYEVVSGLQTVPASSGGYDLRISGTGDARFDGVVLDAYCLSFLDPAAGDGVFDGTPLNTGDIFGAQTANGLGVFSATQVSSYNGENAADNMDLINWIVAQDFEGQGFTGWEVQFAIWELTDNFNSDNAFAANSLFGQAANTDFILAEAAANGDSFVFDPLVDGKLGLVIDPNPETDANSQPFIVAVDFEQFDCLC